MIVGKQVMKASKPCMNMASCAAKAKATYSASQELSATQACFSETQEITLLSLITFKQKPEVDFPSSSSVALVRPKNLRKTASYKSIANHDFFTSKTHRLPITFLPAHNSDKFHVLFSKSAEYSFSIVPCYSSFSGETLPH